MKERQRKEEVGIKLSFKSKPGLNFIFGKQIYSRSPKQRRNIKIDLTSYTTEEVSRVKVEDKRDPDMKDFIAVNIPSGDESSDEELTEDDLNLLRKYLHAKEQKETLDLKSTDGTSVPPIDTSISATDKIEIKPINKPTIDKETKERQVNVKQKKVTGLKSELESMKLELKEKNEFVGRVCNMIERVIEQLKEDKSLLMTLIDLIKETAKITEDSKLLDQERILKSQFTINYALQITSNINLKNIETLITNLQLIFTNQKPLHNSFKKYEEQLNRIKTENAILSSKTCELKKAITNVQQWGVSKDVNESRREALIEERLKERVEALEKELSEANSELKEQSKRYSRRVVDLEESFNKVMQEKEEIENENLLLNEKIAEALNEIQIKNKDIQMFNKELTTLREEYRKLSDKMNEKDVTFLKQVKELKEIFKDMSKEKEENRKIILKLTKKLNAAKKGIKQKTVLTEDNLV